MFVELLEIGQGEVDLETRANDETKYTIHTRRKEYMYVPDLRFTRTTRASYSSFSDYGFLLAKANKRPRVTLKMANVISKYGQRGDGAIFYFEQRHWYL